ncbi:helix-turn-helix domain-containing protein [Paenibacillus turicensis]|uniref:helix-turn-helix domain-containing protein n=1 Tax=Paenibacillus turicensis TaxID=160487 RepID=UPI003D2B778B
MDTLGERIAFLRKKNQMSQNLLMKELHFNNLGKYELNERLPKLDLIIDLARFFNVTTDWLLLGTEPNHKNESNCPISNDDTQKEGPQDYSISAGDQHFLSLYHQLTDRQQAKVEGYIEGLLSAEHTHP